MITTRRGTVGFTCGVFDFVHAGHVAMLEAARRQCSYLIVGLQTDPSIDRTHKNVPIQSTYGRYVQLRGLTCVDEIIPYDSELNLIDILTIEPIDMRFVGEEYQSMDFTGKQTCIDRGITLVYIPRQGGTSSRTLRERIIQRTL